MTQSTMLGSVARKENDMAYTRKTRDIYEVQVNYGYGFEAEAFELTKKQAEKTAILYLINVLKPVRIVKRRERINETSN